MPEPATVKIVFCMGSSCFSRGNGRLLKALQDYLQDAGAAHRVSISGSLCENNCTAGPNITIDGEPHSVTGPEELLRLVARRLGLQDAPTCANQHGEALQ